MYIFSSIFLLYNKSRGDILGIILASIIFLKDNYSTINKQRNIILM